MGRWSRETAPGSRVRMVVNWKVKVCLVGDVGVGKTSLIKRYVNDSFEDRYLMTMGAKVVSKDLDFHPPGGVEERRVSMLIWDVMGAKGVKDLLQEAYFYKASGILAVCDLTRSETLESLRDWIASVEAIAGSVSCIVLANKVDLKGKLAVQDAEIHRLCGTINAPYLKTSAKTGENVEVAFSWLVRSMFEKAAGTPARTAPPAVAA